MPIINGITEKGTVWIKKLDRQGRLLQKRVLQNRIQYDTYFNRFDGRPSVTVFTNHRDKTQFAAIFPRRIFSAGKKYKTLDLSDAANNSPLTGMYNDLLRRITGFKNKKFNRLSEQLCSEYLEKLEQMVL